MECHLEPRVQNLERTQELHHQALHGDNRDVGLLARTKSLETAMTRVEQNRQWLITIVVGMVINAVLILLSNFLRVS